MKGIERSDGFDRKRSSYARANDAGDINDETASLKGAQSANSRPLL